MKAVRLKSSGQSVGRRMIYGGKDLWNRCVLSLEMNDDGGLPFDRISFQQH